MNMAGFLRDGETPRDGSSAVSLPGTLNEETESSPAPRVTSRVVGGKLDDEVSDDFRML